nr:wall-associated receptor kinase 2-like [Ipomoea batatas]
MSFFLVLLLLVLSAVVGFAPTTATSKSNYPIAKPNCLDRCGDVSIPFPFGLTQDCALNPAFFINCTTATSTDGSPIPLLVDNNNIEVTRISVEGQLNTKSFIVDRCYNKSESRARQNLLLFSSWSLPSELMQLYLNQTGNKFVAVGCDTFGYVYGAADDGSFKTEGCVATCNNTQGGVQNGSCSGFGCCETGIPNVARGVVVSVDSVNYYANTSGIIPCSYVFIVQKEEFNFSTTFLTNTNWYLEREPQFTMVLDWTISKQTCSEACLGNTTCLLINGTFQREGYRCGCKEGYEGNPYLSPGCQDIDECKGKNNCSKNSICINTEGGYECSCMKGYHGDGMGALGCTVISSNHQSIGLVLGIALGTIALLITVFCVYLGYRRRKSILIKEKFFMENGGLILQQKIAKGSASSGTTRIFTTEDLKRATNNYDQTRIIGQGGFGIVYKGHLLDGQIIAVKKAKMMDPTQVEQFINENQLFKILDNNIVCEENTEELREVALLAKKCLNVKGEDRPMMKEVAVELSGLRRAAKHPWTNNSETSMESEALLMSNQSPSTMILHSI